VLGEELGWDGARRRAEIVAYEDLVTERYQAPTVARAAAALAEAR
jgi:hypothetical protein